MTASSPRPDVLAALDQLDALRAAGTKGSWHVAKSGAIDAGEYDTVIGGGPVDCMSYCYGGISTVEGDNLPADAALIVAAVNALPQLTAAVRAVHALADEHDKWVRTNRDMSYRFAIQKAREAENFHLGLAQAQEASARKLRAVLAALTPDTGGQAE